MPLLTVVLVLLVVGILLALIENFGPPYLDATILRIIQFVVILATILWLLKIFGVWAYLGKVTV